MALDASQIGVWEHDLGSSVLLWDDRVNEIYGKPANGELREFDDWASTVHPQDRKRATEDFEGGAASGHYSSECRLLLPTGEVRNVRSCAIRYQEGSSAPRMIGAEWDVTADATLSRELENAKALAEIKNAELEAAQAQIEHDALHDPLTGLQNRRYLDEKFKNWGTRRVHDGAALLHVDLDRFKQINDTRRALSRSLVEEATRPSNRLQRSRVRTAHLSAGDKCLDRNREKKIRKVLQRDSCIGIGVFEGPRLAR